MYGSVIWISYKNYKILKKKTLKTWKFNDKNEFICMIQLCGFLIKIKKIKKNLKHENFWVKSCIFERKVDKIDCKSHILYNF